jgi:hypothetical protein
MKKYLADILCIAVVAVLAVLGVEKAEIKAKVHPPGGDRGRPAKVEKKEQEKPAAGIIRSSGTAKVLKERNLFAGPGSPAAGAQAGAAVGGPPGAKITVLQGAYTLIGILNGEQRKAVFRDNSGVVVTLNAGQKLNDGMVITRINERSVELAKGGEKKELKLFDVKVPPLTRVGKKE